MLSKEEIETCKEEARNYIEFMETAGDNAGWTRGLMWYIEHLESNEQKLIEKLEGEHIITKTKYSETLSPFQYGRLEVIEEILEIVKGEKNE